MSKSDDYLWDRSGDVDPDVARLEELMLPLAHREPLDELRLRRRRSRMPILIAMVGAAAAVLVLVWWRWPRTEITQPVATCTGTTGFKLTAQGGAVACNGAS